MVEVREDLVRMFALWVCKSLESSTKELESCEISAILYGFFVEILNWVCGLVKMAARWLVSN